MEYSRISFATVYRSAASNLISTESLTYTSTSLYGSVLYEYGIKLYVPTRHVQLSAW
jgi:hypothetical protein